MFVTVDFGKRLQKRRLELGISRAELAKRAGCTENCIARYERGPIGSTGPHPSKVRSIADALDMGFLDLTGASEKDVVVEARPLRNEELVGAVRDALKAKIEADGVLQKDIAESLGKSPQALSFDLTKENRAAGALMSIAKACGYKMCVSFARRKGARPLWVKKKDEKEIPF